jgi:hypothetical protein
MTRTIKMMKGHKRSHGPRVWEGGEMRPTITVNLAEYEAMLLVCSVVKAMVDKRGPYSVNYPSVMQFLQDLRHAYTKLPEDLPYEMLLGIVTGIDGLEGHGKPWIKERTK